MAFPALLLGLLLAPSAFSNPWSLELTRDRRGSGAELSYRVRWDLADLRRAAGRREPTASASPAGLLRSLLNGTRLSFHGIRLKPFAAFVRDPATSVASGAPEAAAAPSAMDELKRDAAREVRRFFLMTAFNRALPSAKQAPYWQKATVASSLAAAGRNWADRRWD